ncbi:glutathione S-transferase family protein [Steroidobacter sp.]|uniref:glutathione S-transferase family protein n=1 Tax=Steroidobacter sp. TaxID=1978227 RepID=UPI001A482C84|nr:glutathione S-transferase family protein [Steroidobacter sp.]MBL8268453.1 glutathione S-transferase [Steroidobacter sp.]
MTRLQIVGRRSSHFTRLTRVFAEELGVAHEIAAIYDMTLRDPAIYADNPALKLPILRCDDGVIFGAENICRALAERAPSSPRLVWPEQLKSNVSRNAQELVWYCMAAQVQLVFGTVVAQLPADNLYFEKARTGFVGALHWLDTNLSLALGALPADRQLSLFEASLFCLVDHLQFRKTVPVEPYSALLSFTQAFAERPSAQRTTYQFDVPPTAEE